MSDTPRTDAAETIVPSDLDADELWRRNGEYVSKDFARTLERERNLLELRWKLQCDAADQAAAALEAAHGDARRWQALCSLWAASTEMLLRQDEEGTWSITQVEDVEGERFKPLVGADPNAAIDAAARK